MEAISWGTKPRHPDWELDCPATQTPRLNLAGTVALWTGARPVACGGPLWPITAHHGPGQKNYIFYKIEDTWHPRALDPIGQILTLDRLQQNSCPTDPCISYVSYVHLEPFTPPQFPVEGCLTPKEAADSRPVVPQ